MAMTQEQKDAVEWLDGMTGDVRVFGEYARVIKAMLAEPRMPREWPDGAIDAMVSSALNRGYLCSALEPHTHTDAMRAAYNALGDFLWTRQRPKPPEPTEFVARIDGDKVCYCQPATPDNIQEAEEYRRQFGGRVVRLTRVPT